MTRRTAETPLEPGASLERALMLFTEGKHGYAIFQLDASGEIAHAPSPDIRYGILTAKNGAILAPAEHPINRFRAAALASNNSSGVKHAHNARSKPAIDREIFALLFDTGHVELIELSTAHLAATSTGPESLALVATNVTNRDRALDRFKLESETDSLTGVTNLRGLMTRVADALRRARPVNDHVALVAVCLDGFKFANEITAGALGQMVICETANRLRKCTRDNETVAFLGGTRFAVLLQQVANSADAIAAAERMRRSINAPMKFGQRELRISASIGVALSGQRADDPNELLANADIAAREARDQGENDWAVFDDATRTRTLQRMRAEDFVDEALRHDWFSPAFQVVVRAANSQTAGFEALARIRVEHSMSTLTFLDAAERSGRITPVDRRILDLACDQAKRLDERAPGSYRISVNLSTQTALRPDLYSFIFETIEEYHLRPSALALELNERTLLEAGTATKAALWELRDDGVSVLLDGFGGGRVGLPFLTDFPIAAVKLHMRSVQGIASSTTDRLVVGSTISMARALGISVSANGVETLEQATVLRELGCDYLQGYLFGKPMSAVESEQFLPD